MRRLLERFLEPDTFLKMWAGVVLFWLALIAVLIALGIHFAGKHW